MEYIIKYTKNKNWYVRVGEDWKLLLSIPNRLKNNETFKQELLDKGQILLKRMSKFQKLETNGDDFVIIFGEKVDKSELPKNIDKYLKELLLEYSQPLVDHYAGLLWKKYKDLTIRKVKTKRGSCTHDQRIMLNQKLIHLPTQYIKYVIIHEVCHLKQKDHSPKFRSLVEEYCADWKKYRKEMRKMILK